jgi:hypothetical protein
MKPDVGSSKLHGIEERLDDDFASGPDQHAGRQAFPGVRPQKGRVLAVRRCRPPAEWTGGFLDRPGHSGPDAVLRQGACER